MSSVYDEDEVAKALESLTGQLPAAGANEQLVPSGQRPCPICGNVMAVETHEGISIDVCAAHGMWLDNGELPRIVQAARSRVRSADIQSIRRASQDGKITGALLGWWSLLLP